MEKLFLFAAILTVILSSPLRAEKLSHNELSIGVGYPEPTSIDHSEIYAGFSELYEGHYSIVIDYERGLKGHFYTGLAVNYSRFRNKKYEMYWVDSYYNTINSEISLGYRIALWKNFSLDLESGIGYTWFFLKYADLNHCYFDYHFVEHGMSVSPKIKLNFRITKHFGVGIFTSLYITSERFWGSDKGLMCYFNDAIKCKYIF